MITTTAVCWIGTGNWFSRPRFCLQYTTEKNGAGLLLQFGMPVKQGGRLLSLIRILFSEADCFRLLRSGFCEENSYQHENGSNMPCNCPKTSYKYGFLILHQLQLLPASLLSAKYLPESQEKLAALIRLCYNIFIEKTALNS